jgi:hypothetical protein
VNRINPYTKTRDINTAGKRTALATRSSPEKRHLLRIAIISFSE